MPRGRQYGRPSIEEEPLSEKVGGSDFLALETTARRDGGDWVLNGRKFFVTGGPVVEVALLFARVEGATREQISAFLVPLDAPGVQRVRVIQTLMTDGYTGELAFDDVRVAAIAETFTADDSAETIALATA